MPLDRFSRLFHTVRYLKPRQIGWRLYYRLMRRRVRHHALAPPGPVSQRQWAGAWSAPAWMPPCRVGTDEFMFLGERGYLRSAVDWNHPGKSKLWLYNLHYLDDLCSQEAEARFAVHRVLVQRWIDENPPLAGNGWEPYPLSLRLVNLVKWLAGPTWRGGEPVPGPWLESLARQAQALSAQREYHILANHLFANGKALTFAGAFLQGEDAERWLGQGLAILDAELLEQFLDDGGHFERSPMYHATLLWDLADLIRLAECSGLPALEVRAATWRETLARGLAWLDMMTHPDGEIGFFNDAAFGIGPTLTDLKRYAEMLGINTSTPGVVMRKHEGLDASFTVRHAQTSGYVSLDWEQGGKALLDLAPVGPDYQPGHAHADTLSFELSLFGQRVLANSGISQYGEDSERHRQRATLAHNTVTVDGQNSSEVWAGFRVARRARPGAVSIDAREGALTVGGSHDGYRRLPGRVVHYRQWRFQEGELILRDRLEGRFSRAEARFHCHPAVTLALQDARHGELILPGGERLAIAIEGGEARSETTTWHPRFGESQSNHCLVVAFTAPRCTTSFCWA
ncbi:alginate lyase family protein [Halomonas kalidii]|uniref:Alginate lyase family protein n=1 Tax=Halomonas kalidii TaxID=3043293 RepID=A0ABT6VK49_9GAMM|nr:alginate lyase family protein [Halomonas kalidii]MDI5934357.1 alginate lyase family protein [Halomonas kalidii]